ncbi:MAG TPA: tetratricopeptide repeat protein, partial [Allocoleopsis sp.]
WETESKEYLQAQMYLVKSYQALGDIQTTIKLCQELVKSANNQVQNWAISVLNSLSTVIPEKPKVTLQICIDTFNQGNYLSAINLLEELLQNSTDITVKEHLQAQMYLVKAYNSSKQTTKAIALCQQLTKSDNIQVQNWAIQTLNLLKGN